MMNEYSVEVLVDEAYQDKVDVADLEEVVRRTLAKEGLRSAALTLVITDDDRVRELNRAYRGVDATTDVLSFPMQEGEPIPGESEPYLGDVVIAFPVAQEQAQAYGHSVQEELRLLTVHGVLHLLGYDHETPEEEARMWARQEEILGKAYVGPGGVRRKG